MAAVFKCGGNSLMGIRASIKGNLKHPSQVDIIMMNPD